MYQLHSVYVVKWVNLSCCFPHTHLYVLLSIPNVVLCSYTAERAFRSFLLC